jgi:hypothetical protein
MLSPQTAVWDACKEAMKSHPGFEWAGFHNGLFMNYLGNGCRNEEEALAGKSDDGETIYYMAGMVAKIPLRADGKVPRISMTEIGDIGRFVAAACSLPKWEENFSMVGQTLRMDEIVALIEKVRGKKMEVEYRTPEQIRIEKEGEKDLMKVFWLELEEMETHDALDESVMRPILNELCPDVKPMAIEEYLRKFWSDS